MNILKTFVVISMVMLAFLIPKAHAQVLDTVYQNSFEDGFKGAIDGNCNYEWERTSDSANHGNYSLGFESSKAPQGCYTSAGEDDFSTVNIQPKDTFLIRADIYLSKDTADARDFSLIRTYDENGELIVNFSMPRWIGAYETSGGPGWYTIINNISGQRILDSTLSTNFTAYYYAVSGGNGKDIGLDNIRIVHYDDYREPNLTITNPSSFDNLTVASETTIEWEANATFEEKVNIAYSTNGGNNWAPIENNVDVSSGQYEWVVPNTTTSGNGLIRIVNASDQSRGDTINNLTIESNNVPTLTLVEPSENDTFKTNNQVKVEWVANDEVDQIDIEFSEDDGDSWQTVVSDLNASESNYDWTSPSSPVTNAQIRVVDANNASIVDASGPFAIVDEIRNLTLNQPSAGDTLNGGNTYTIEWTASEDVNEVMLELSEDGGSSWNTITSNEDANQESYEWDIPEKTIEEAVIRVTDEDDASVTAESGTFYVQESMSIYSLSKEHPLNIYPNPAIDQINILLSEKVKGKAFKAQIFNLQGKKMYESILRNVENETRLDVSNFSKGIYFIKIKVDNNQYVGKFAKQ